MKTIKAFELHLAYLYLVIAGATFAQSEAPLPRLPAPVDVRQTLERHIGEVSRAGSSVADAELKPKSREEMAADFKSAADGARLMRSSTNAMETAEAKRMEATSLLQAVLAGDDTLEQRAMALVDDARQDILLSAQSRFSVVALAEIVRARKWSGDFEAQFKERQESARRLIAEFPQELGGYEALLRVAENCADPEQRAQLLREVTAPAAPLPVKLAALTLVDRYALIGKSLLQIADETLSEKNVIRDAIGRNLVLYTWSTWSPGNSLVVKKFFKISSPRFCFVGVCLDEDTAKASAFAVRESLPGEQIYDSRGVASPLARALKLSAAMPVYLVSENGEIRDVSAENGDLSTKLRSAR